MNRYLPLTSVHLQAAVSPVGKVVRIQPDKLFYTVEVKLAVDFSSLTHVLIAPLKIETEKIEMIRENTSGETFP